MNTRTIEPVEFWTPDGVKEADTLLLYNFHGYNFDGNDSIVSYKLGFTEESGGNSRWVSLTENSVSVPDSVVQQWGQDDDPIFSYVIQVLNLTEV